jgi:hypothetical protein
MAECVRRSEGDNQRCSTASRITATSLRTVTTARGSKTASDLPPPHKTSRIGAPLAKPFAVALMRRVSGSFGASIRNDGVKLPYRLTLVNIRTAIVVTCKAARK